MNDRAAICWHELTYCHLYIIPYNYGQSDPMATISDRNMVWLLFEDHVYIMSESGVYFVQHLCMWLQSTVRYWVHFSPGCEIVQRLLRCGYCSRAASDLPYRIAGNFRGLNFSRIGRFWIVAVNIFTVAFAPRPRPLLVSAVRFQL